MKAKCQEYGSEVYLSDRTATATLITRGEVVNAYCNRCESHHLHTVKA